MMRNKVQVDAHVSSTLKELNSKHDKLLRGYNFAKMYYDIKEFDKAEEYLQGFLSVKANYAPAYKLLAQIYESKSKDFVDILEVYKKSYEIDYGQKDVLLKILELYANNTATPEEARFWSEKAEKYFPNHDVVAELKLKAQENQLNSNNSNNANKLMELYEAESVKYPKDIGRKVKLLRSYMSVGRIGDAYAIVVKAEMEEIFNTLEWYKCAVEVLLEFKRNKQGDLSSEFYEVLMIVLCLYSSLTISQSTHISNAVNALWSLDQELYTMKEDIYSDLMNELRLEMRAQYLFLCGTLILHKAQKENLSWRTLIDPSYACFLSSMAQGPLDFECSILKNNDEKKIKFLKRWKNISLYRCSQIGHILKKKYDTDSCGNKWLRRLQDEYFHKPGRSRISQIVYSDSQSKEALEKSYLCCALTKNATSIPSFSQLAEWDGEVQVSQSENLELLVWICLHYYDSNDEIQPEYPFALYNNLPYGCERMESSEPSTLCQLDIQTFLMAVVKCSAINHAENLKLCDLHRPFLLPFCINESFCSKPQLQWWASIGQPQNASVLRKGLEVVRLIGPHGMHVKLLTHLAKTWAHKHAQQKQLLDTTFEFTDKDSFLEAQAFHFWSNALVLIEKQLGQQSPFHPKVSIFESRNFGTPCLEDLEKLLQEGKLFHSLYLKNANNLTEALKILKSIRCSSSYYEMAKIYKDMADEGENTVDQRNLLSKANNALEESLKMCKVSWEMEKIKADINDVEMKLLDLQNENEFVSELDYSTLGEASIVETPQKHSVHTKTSFMTSSTPFARKNRGLLELEGTGLAYIMHYVDQKISTVNDDYKRLQDKVIMLESKVAILEAQRMMWMSMPYPMMPQAHVQVYPGAPFKSPNELDLTGRFAHSSLDKMNANYQQGVLPAFSSSQRMPCVRSNTDMIDDNKFHQENIQCPGDLSSFGSIDVDNEGGFVNQGNILNSIDKNILQKPNALFNGKFDNNTVTPKFGQCAQGTEPISTTAAPDFKVQGLVSQGALVNLLSSQTPLEQVINNADKSCKKDGEKISTNSPAFKNLFGNSNSCYDKTPTSMSSTSFATSDTIPSLKSNYPKIDIKNIATPVFVGTSVSSTPVTDKTTKDELKISENVKDTSANPLANFTFGVKPSGAKSHFTFSFTEPTPTIDNKETKEEEPETEDHVDDFEPTGEFKPLVNLPIVNVVTGEEDCNKLFGERGKLYRMDFDAKQWKERGVGEIKILENKINKKSRILMRRDQVFKVCANHFITADMKLKAMDSSENSYCWIAMDYAEEETKKEQFCIKFKTKEVADAFKNCFETCQNNTNEKNQDRPSTDNSKLLVGIKKQVDPEPKESISLSEQFKAKDGEWECIACYVKNPSSSTSCLACEKVKPGLETTLKPVTQSEIKFAFGSQGGFQFSQMSSKSFGNISSGATSGLSSLAEQFKATKGEWECTECYVKNPASSTSCLACEKVKPGHESTPKPVTQSEAKVAFGSQGGFQFGQVPGKVFGSFGNVSSGVSSGTSSLADQFRANDGQWNCKDCYVQNPPSSTSCLACEKVKPGHESTIKPVTQSENKVVFGSQGGFQFGQVSSNSFGYEFPPKPITSSTETFGVFAKPVESASKKNEKTSAPLTSSFVSSTSNTSAFKFTLPVSSVGLQKDTSSIPSFSFAVPSNADSLKSPIKHFNVNDVMPKEVLLTTEDEFYNNVDGEDAHIHFEPIVKLPENYEIKTLEESETIVYSENAKIFRFHNNEWKEKGSGVVKLLKSQENGKVRVLMRRDKIHKICCNHYITADMQLHPLMNNNKALVWYAYDFVDGDQTLQQLCIRFKKEESAAEFKKCFEEVVKGASMKATDSAVEDCVVTCIEEPSENLLSEANRWLLPKSFYNYLNAPPCKGCIGCKDEEFEFSHTDIASKQDKKKDTPVVESTPVSNALPLQAPASSVQPTTYSFAQLNQSKQDEKKEIPVVESTPISNAVSLQAPASSVQAPTFASLKAPTFASLKAPTFASLKQNVASNGGFSFQTPLSSSEPSSFTFASLKQGIVSNDAKDSSTPKNESSKEMSFSEKPGDVAAMPKSIFTSEIEEKNQKFPNVSTFGSVSSGCKSEGSSVFGSLSKTLDFSTLSNNSSTFKSDTSFSWKGAGEKLFTTLTPEKTQVSVKEAENDDENEEVEVERDIHFEPIVNLPEVALTTGEESEDEIFKQRAVLYRFDGQWKERGVGDMKILKHCETGAHRLLMRRDQIHKVVCNHLITSDISFKFMESSEKALCWYANDFSEEGKVEQFALKFKTQDLAKEFKQMVEECQSTSRSTK